MLNRRTFLFALALTMTGCGYRGALYLPEDAPQQPQTVTGNDAEQPVSGSEQQ